MQKSKSIILCIPSLYGISKPIISALNKQGYTVYDFILSDATFKYKNIFHRLYNLYRKILLNDSLYKRHLKMHALNQDLSVQLEHVPHADYALFIRPDLFPKEFIEQVKNKTTKIAAYQWDGLNRFPIIHEYINLFDRFFVFDHKDLNKENKILPITNFYIEDDARIEHSSIKETSPKRIFFLATYDDYRFELMNKLKKVFEQANLACDLFFVTNNKKHLAKVQKQGYIIPKDIDYLQNLVFVQQSSILIDLVTPFHSGLSFRIFEALYYEVKLITDNKTVKEYDFYHPNNIFVWDGTNESEILAFLELEYIPIAAHIKQKYSFENWIKYVFDDGEYLPIQLPNIKN